MAQAARRALTVRCKADPLYTFKPSRLKRAQKRRPCRPVGEVGTSIFINGNLARLPGTSQYKRVLEYPSRYGIR